MDDNKCPKCGARQSHDVVTMNGVEFSCGTFIVLSNNRCWQSPICKRLVELSSRLTEVRTILETAVCTSGCDKGVVLLSDVGRTHTEIVDGKPFETYDHAYFSPLGDALIAAWEKTNG